MLDVQTIATVKATIPLLLETGPKLTAHFYDRMFTHNPELKDIFNMSNQRNGDQREALFNAIAAYASNLDNLAALLRWKRLPKNTPVFRSGLRNTTLSAIICWRPLMRCSAQARKSSTHGVKLMGYWLASLFSEKRNCMMKMRAKPAAGKERARFVWWKKPGKAR
jgi:hypothetical protein